MRKLALLAALLFGIGAYAQAPTCPAGSWPYPNDTGTGTTQWTLTKLNSSGNAVIMATTDTTGFVGIAVTSVGTQAGNVCIARVGIWPVKMDGTSTKLHYVQISSGTGGDGTDTGASTYPTGGGDVIGRVQTSSSGAGGFSLVDLGPEVNIGTVTAHTLSSIMLCADTSSSSTTYTCTTTPSIGSLATGDTFIFTSINQNNSGSSTLNIDSIGAKTIKKWQNTANLASGDLQASGAILLTYDGTNLEATTIGNAPSSNGVSVIYSTPSTSSPTGGTTNTISSTTLVTPGANTLYSLKFAVEQTGATAGCSGQPTMTITVAYTDAGSSVAMSTPDSWFYQNGGISAGGSSPFITMTFVQTTLSTQSVWGSAPFQFYAKSGVAVTYNTNISVGSGCSTGAAYTVIPVLTSP